MKSLVPLAADGGSQFPPLETLDGIDDSPAVVVRGDAMSRLDDRQAQSGEQASSKNEGFEASIHRIKEQVLPRLLERVDPEAAATLSKDELAEEFRPIIGEVLAELKINLNRREQFALEKVLVDELLGLGPLEELLNDPDVSDIMVNGPNQTYIEKKGKLTVASIQFRDEEHLLQIAQRIVNKVGRRVDRPRRWPTPASPTAAASTSSSRRSRCAAPPSRS
jgi:pilus assembly protein CpaF